MEVPLPWERLLWRGRPLSFRRARYALTDFRLVSTSRGASMEIAIDDIAEVRCVVSRLDRLCGASTIIVRGRDSRRPSLILHRVRGGEQLAALLDLLAAGPRESFDPDVVRAALSAAPWQTRGASARARNTLVGVAAVVVASFGLAIGIHGSSPTVNYPPDDAIYPKGHKRNHEDIVHFMETSVMPWAREKLGPIVGGRDRVTCATCHGPDPARRAWQMPGVVALPKPDVIERGWEQYSSNMDAQMRNAIYGYGAESGNQAKAAYMREVVLPGMSRLLHRPAYDFTNTYDYNRTRFAFGCYHCHHVQ